MCNLCNLKFVIYSQVYTIEITVNDCTWSVQHRYSEFIELHEGLIAADKANKSIHLPPKKLIGNSSKSFIQKRQKELEAYLQTVVEKNPTLPKPLLHFLEFDIYVSFWTWWEVLVVVVSKFHICLNSNAVKLKFVETWKEEFFLTNFGYQYNSCVSVINTFCRHKMNYQLVETYKTCMIHIDCTFPARMCCK